MLKFSFNTPHVGIFSSNLPNKKSAKSLNPGLCPNKNIVLCLSSIFFITFKILI